MKNTTSKAVFFVMLLLALLGFVNSPVALVSGFLFTLFFKHPYEQQSQKGIHHLLKIAIVGLGFGMYVTETLRTGKEGLGLTVFSIFLTVGLGLTLVKVLGIDRKLGHLITSGTSICGGSAIAAVSPIIKVHYKTISIALGIVFLLNSIALFLFPVLGHWLHLTQEQFGLWCAVAIHDTSSVVGAAMGYGDEALRVATTVKLSRTLWIIPLSVFSMFWFKTRGERIRIPYFILAFVAAILINSYHLLPVGVTENMVLLSKRLLVLTLFLVGTTLNISDLKMTGLKPVVFAVILWVFISLFSLAYILS